MVATVTPLQPRRNATQKTLAAWAMSLPDEAADCRDLGHMWARAGNVQWDEKERAYRTNNHCVRKCGVSRQRIIAMNGDIRSQSYKYPHDDNGNNTYLMPAGHGGWTADARAEVRLAGLQRAMGTDTRSARRQRA